MTTGPKLFFDAAPGSVVHYDNIRMRNNDGDIRSFSDDFSDGNYTADPAWTAGGTWTVTGADNHMQNTVSGSSSWFRRAAPCEDFVLDFTYTNLDTSNNLHRVVVTATDLDSPNQDGVEAQFKSSGMQLFQKVNGTSTSLDYDGTSSVQGTKYRVRIVRDGSRVEVWRGADDAPMTKVLESDAISVGGYDRLTFAVSAGAQFAVDDIVLGVDDPETVVYTHNAANELLAMDGPAALARFDYDAWGRTVTKRRVSGAATHRAVYGYRFGQRLKSVQTDLPGEQSADYNYDGLGKRRNKVIDGDATWFRWDAGWNMIAEYDGGANQQDWDPGDLAMTYVPGLAQVPGTNPATGAYGYFAADHLGSTRGVYNQSKAMTAALEYAPYGEPRAWRGDAPAPTYTGHYHDAESGLYFAPYRYYLPDAGPFYPPRVIRAVFSRVIPEGLDLRAALDGVITFSPGARWFSWDRNGGAGGHQPNGIPDGYEFYLLERILVEGSARPGVSQAMFEETAAAWSAIREDVETALSGHADAAGIDAITAYLMLGDAGSRFAANYVVSRNWPASAWSNVEAYGNGRNASGILGYAADPDNDGFGNLAEYEFARLHYPDHALRAEKYVEAALDPAIPGPGYDPALVETVTLTIEVIGQGTVNLGAGTHTFAKYPRGCAEPCEPIEVTLSATPAEGWAFRRWWGTWRGRMTASTEIDLYDSGMMIAEFVYRPGIAELDLVADFAHFLSYAAPGVSVETFDRNAIEYDAEGEPFFTGNGIPDAAEFHLLEHVMRNAGIDLSARSGVTSGRTFEAWQTNLARARLDLGAGTHPSIRRVVAAYMTMGGHDTVQSLLDLLAGAGVQALPDPADYDRSRQRFFGGKKDADNDGLTNADQWELVDGLAWNDRLAAFAMNATNGTREDGGAGGSTGGGAGLPGCDTPACLPTREVKRAEALLGIGGTATGPIGSASERLPFGTPLTVSAEPDEDYSFIMWFAPGSLIDGSRELQEAGFPLPPGDTPFAPKAVFSQKIVRVKSSPYVSISVTGGTYQGTDDQGRSLYSRKLDETLELSASDANPNDGFVFHQWAGNAPIAIGYSRDSRVSVDSGTFTPMVRAESQPPEDTANITASAAEGGRVFVAGTLDKTSPFLESCTVLRMNGSPYVVASPNDGYVFVRWEGEVQNPQSSGTYIKQDALESGSVSVRAVFQESPRYTLEVQTHGCGHVAVSPARKFYRWLDSLSLRAVPCEGYFFSHWEGDVSIITYGGCYPEEHNRSAINAIIPNFDARLRAVFVPLQIRTVSIVVDGTLLAHKNAITAIGTWNNRMQSDSDPVSLLAPPCADWDVPVPCHYEVVEVIREVDLKPKFLATEVNYIALLNPYKQSRDVDDWVIFCDDLYLFNLGPRVAGVSNENGVAIVSTSGNWSLWAIVGHELGHSLGKDHSPAHVGVDGYDGVRLEHNTMNPDVSAVGATKGIIERHQIPWF